jgi:hypothetical protein
LLTPISGCNDVATFTCSHQFLPHTPHTGPSLLIPRERGHHRCHTLLARLFSWPLLALLALSGARLPFRSHASTTCVSCVHSSPTYTGHVRDLSWAFSQSNRMRTWLHSDTCARTPVAGAMAAPRGIRAGAPTRPLVRQLHPHRGARPRPAPAAGSPSSAQSLHACTSEVALPAAHTAIPRTRVLTLT